MKPLVAASASLTDEEVQRYSRHLIIPDVGFEGQRRIKSAKVLCVGAGGLGSPVLMYLAAAGVGTLGIVDFDAVELSNLQRQVIHGQSDIGQPKAASAESAIREINPLVNVVLHPERLTRENAMTILSDYDIIVDGTDNFATRYLINDAAVLMNKPVVWGSIYRFDGQASVFFSECGPCYRCLFPEPPPAGTVPSCAEGGVLGVLCASIGAIQSTEVIKLITGFGEPLIGRLMIYDALAMTYRTLNVAKDASCPLCSGHQKTLLDDYELFCGVGPTDVQVPAITVQELKHMMDLDEKFLLVDVREPGEFQIVRIPGSTLIPQAEILSGVALASLPQDRKIVLYCKTGVRSAKCQSLLQGAGFEALNLTGGVTAWAREIDTSLPLY